MSCCLTGIAVYRWQVNHYEKEVMNVEQLRDENIALKREVDELELQLEQYTDVDFADMQAVRGALCGPLNEDPSVSILRYENPERGIAFDIPYNENWGFGKRIPEPYVEREQVNALFFGSPTEVGPDPCRWMHSIQLTFLPVRSDEDIQSQLDAQQESAQSSITTQKIGENTYSSYKLSGICELQNFELRGEKFSYVFSSCDDSEALRNVLESVVLL